MLPSVPTDAHEPGTQVPFVALELAPARSRRAFCAFSLLSTFPSHVTIQVFCNAFPYEKERCHGSDGFCLCIVLRLIVATSSLSSSRGVSPLRKKIPGHAEGPVRLRALTVKVAISSEEARGPVRPFLTMFGLSTIPSKTTLCNLSAANCARRTFSVTSAHTVTSWSPFGTISGSTMG